MSIALPISSKMKYILAAVMLLLIGGCVVRSVGGYMGRKLLEKELQQQVGKHADVKMGEDGAMQFATSEGTVSTGNAVPADWPTDVPVYPGAAVQYSASVNPSGGKKGNALILMSLDDVQKVSDYYKDALGSQGWASVQVMNAGGTMIMSMTKDDRTLSLTIAGSGGKTNITFGIEGKAE